MTQRHLIVDLGGTSTQAAVAEQGAILSRTSLPSFKPKPPNHRADELCRSLGAWLASRSPEFLQPGFVLLGVAGVWDAMERQAYLNAFTDAWVTYVADHVPRTSVLSDLELALFAGLGAKPGAMLIAGTGSIAAMRLDDGTIRRVGGWGPRVDDAGGGFWMGRAALLAVARAMDGRGEATLLSIPVAAHLRVDHADSTALANALRTASVDRIARLAPAVLAYAEEGDAVARSIRAEAARELASLVLALPASNTTVQLHGSLFLDPFFHAAVVHLLEGSGRGLSTRLLDDVLASAALRLHSGIEEA